MGEPTSLGLKTILLEARTRRGAERAAYLDRVCAGNPALREEIDSLLAFEAAVPSLLDDNRLLRQLEEKVGLTPTVGVDGDDSTPGTAPPLEQIGPYRLIDVIGEGGMGIVYRAEQTAPIRRDVALKLIRRGLDTDRVVARFDSERQALARMDHPGIARVLDAGASAGGRPYFVMELVHGLPITEFCDRERLEIRERLALVIAVCQAIQHAHQKGIVHRDLKPSNILVARQDGVPAPKVIDFGIAKAIEDPLIEHSLLTREGQFIGTPDYMSPEQAGVLDVGVDTRTDVYALGVLLYELLSGRRPHQFDKRTQEEVQKILRHQDPPRLSTGLATRRLTRATGTLEMEASQRIATARQLTPERLRRQLVGDLETIVAKAVQKEPARRYSSVEQLADDIRRHLDGQPVLARPDTWSYRTGKFVRRHAMAVAVASAAVLLLTAFAVTTAVQAQRIARERDRALVAEQRARTEAEIAHQVSNFLVGLFRVSDPNEARGAAITAREMLDRGAARITTELKDSPEVRGRLLYTMGAVYKQLGLYDQAITIYQQAVSVRESGDPIALAETLDELGDTQRYAGRLADAEPNLERALALRRQRLGPAAPKVAQTLNNLALVYVDEGEYEKAEAAHRDALRIRRAALEPRHPDVSNSLSNLGILMRTRGRYAEAEQLLREAVEIRRATLGGDAPVLANSLGTLGGVLADQGRFSEAEPMLREALAIRRKTLGPKHPRISFSLVSLGSLLQDEGKLDAVEPLYVEAVAMNRELMGPRSMDVAVGLNNLGSLYEDRGLYFKAEGFFRESLGIRRELRGDRHPAVATALGNLGALEVSKGDVAAGERLLREALAQHVEQLGERHVQTASIRYHLGRAAQARGALADAEREYRAALAIQKDLLAPRHPSLLSTMHALGRLLVQQNRAADAVTLLKPVVEARRQRYGDADWRTAEAALALGRASLALGRVDDAAPLIAGSAKTLAAAGPARRGLALEAAGALRELERQRPPAPAPAPASAPAAVSAPAPAPAPRF